MIEKKIIKNLTNVEKNIIQLKKRRYIDLINKASKLLISSLKKNNKIIFCGNGGSAADSLHLSAELLGRYLKNRKPYNSIDLNSNIASITAISNDYSYDDIFSRQLMALGKANDILFAITTSGKSVNINKAIKQAKKMKIKVILLTSSKGKKLKKFCDLLIDCPGDRVDRIQEMQKIVGHIICENVESILN
tara:strand:+ start:61 stop:633 length:573 start_codon:yes stop_codon:yes gene_type:complete